MPPPDTQACRPRQPRISGWRISFLVALLLCVAGAFILGVNDYLTFEEISRHREAVMAWRENAYSAAGMQRGFQWQTTGWPRSQ